MVILDTSILIDHLRLRDKQKSYLRIFIAQHPKEILAISVITISELFSGKSTRQEVVEKNMLATIAPLKILPCDYDIASRAGKLMRDSNGIVIADAIIAATAIKYEATLATLNTKDFTKVPGLILV